MAIGTLVDSSLDWGQDLPGVKRYLDEHKVAPPVYFAYFGTGSPDWYGIQARALCSTPGLGQEVPPLFLHGGAAGRRRRTGDGGNSAPAPGLRSGWNRGDGSGNERGAGGKDLRAEADGRHVPHQCHAPAAGSKPIRRRDSGPWNQKYESGYQGLRRAVAPLLTGDETTRAAALKARSPDDWTHLMTVYEHLRFSRLTAFLRQREPDDNINFSILVYRLSDQDIFRALDGPPAEMKPAPPWLFGAAASAGSRVGSDPIWPCALLAGRARIAGAMAAIGVIASRRAGGLFLVAARTRMAFIPRRFHAGIVYR